METILMILMIAAFAIVLGMLTAPLEKKRELIPIPIRIRKEDEQPRRRSSR
ncbi:hypothetical protein [Aquitalea aquatilis]|uniref:hypothetical protein n=1 Tax=Aquitalea aquatilis TaxID=1537400 RepID=UPI00143DC6D6|nr:hypothetical protein [Aquitalea aquatilis]